MRSDVTCVCERVRDRSRHLNGPVDLTRLHEAGGAENAHHLLDHIDEYLFSSLSIRPIRFEDRFEKPCRTFLQSKRHIALDTLSNPIAMECHLCNSWI